MRLILVRSWTLVVISTTLAGLAVIPSATRAETHVLVPQPVHRGATAAVHEVVPVSPVVSVSPVARVSPVASVSPAASVSPVAPDIDVPGLRRHVKSLAKLIGHPARELVAKLGTAATVDDGAVEWNLVDAGVHAASAYGYASIVKGAVTGFVIRGRAPLDKLLQLHLHRPLQLTLAGGERPSYSITAGE